MSKLRLVTGTLMKRNSSDLNHQAAFTLIEILVVLLIFSIVLSFIIIKVDFLYTENAKLENFSDNLLAKLKLAKQEAVLQHASMRLVLEDDQYGFQVYQRKDDKYEWLWTNDSTLGLSKINHGIHIKIDKQNKEIEPNTLLQIFPNGSFTPFEFKVMGDKSKVTYTLYGDDNNNLGLRKNGK